MNDPDEDIPQEKIDRSVYITNLSFKINDEDLERIFSQAGKVESSHVFFDKELFRPAGRGIVLFSKKEEAHRAIKELDDITVKGRKIKVQLNTKSIRLLNAKKAPVDEEDSNSIRRHSSFSGDHSNDNLRLRRSSRHRPGSSRHHDLHRGRHLVPINDYDYDNYDFDYDYHRIIHSERDRERSRERDRRRGIGKYDYDPIFDRDYDYEQNKSRMNIKEIERKGERKQIASSINELIDDKKLQDPSIRDKKPLRIDYIDHEYGPPPQLQLQPPQLQLQPPLPIIPSSIPVNPSIHGLNTSDDIPNDIPHSVWVKVIKQRSHDVYDDLFSLTKDHQIIKEKTLLRFQPNEAVAVARFVDALSSTPK